MRLHLQVDGRSLDGEWEDERQLTATLLTVAELIRNCGLRRGFASLENIGVGRVLERQPEEKDVG